VSAPFQLAFDELDGGMRFATSGRTLTEADVVGFAALTGDRHPQHTDAEWAGSSRFGERIAHGLLVLSYAAGLVPLDPGRVVALRAVREAVFKRPLRLGDTITAEGELAPRTALDDGHGLVSCRLRILDQRGRVCARAVLELVWAREPGERASVPSAPTAAELAEPLLI
jgi:acyl dehydratase